VIEARHYPAPYCSGVWQARSHFCDNSLALHSRRHYRHVNDTKSGKRREMMARVSFNTACELGFRGAAVSLAQ